MAKANPNTVVALQNGLDNEEYLARYFGPERVIRVVINYAGNVLRPSLIEMTFFHKPNNVGCLCGIKNCGHVSQLAGLLTEAGLDSEACNDIKRCTWRKAILNASLSPLSALLDMTMAQVMDCGDTLRLATGTYLQDPPGLPIFNLNGTPTAPITITGPESGPRPVLLGTATSNTIRLSNASYVVVRKAATTAM